VLQTGLIPGLTASKASCCTADPSFNSLNVQPAIGSCSWSDRLHCGVCPPAPLRVAMSWVHCRYGWRWVEFIVVTGGAEFIVSNVARILLAFCRAVGSMARSVWRCHWWLMELCWLWWEKWHALVWTFELNLKVNLPADSTWSGLLS
jgi:hypothetical protein